MSAAFPEAVEAQVDVAERLQVAEARARQMLANTPTSAHASSLLQAAFRATTSAKRVLWMQRAASSWAAPLEGLGACREGCAHCCHIPLAMTDAEARVLGERIGIKPRTVAGAPVTEVAMSVADLPGSPGADALYSSPCPFLTGSVCEVYEHRPMACRTQVNLDQDDLLCQLKQGQSIQVPYADATMLKAAYVGLQPAAVWADIRAFFPRGRRSLPD